MSTDQKVHPVDERPPILKLGTLGLQHVLVMYAGAIAVPLIIGRALNLSPEQVAMLISADLFCCGLVTLIQAWGFTKWFGIRLPVMMGVTFASVGPMMAVAAGHSGAEGASIIFGSIIGSGLIAIFLAPVISRFLACHLDQQHLNWSIQHMPNGLPVSQMRPKPRAGLLLHHHPIWRWLPP